MPRCRGRAWATQGTDHDCSVVVCPQSKKRSQPISRVLLRRACARYGRHSSRPGVAAGLKPPTRGLTRASVDRPPTWCCSGWRLPRFTRPASDPDDSSLWPCSSPSSSARAATYSVRALPGILLCGARTFLCLRNRAATVWPASPLGSSTPPKVSARGRACATDAARRHAAAPPCRRRTDSSAGTSTASRTRVIVSRLRGRR